MASDRADAWRVWDIGPKLAFEVYLPNSSDSRPWPLQVIDQFTAKTGRPMIPPAWSFGPRRRINRGAMQMNEPEVQAMRDLGLALTVLDEDTHFLPDGSDRGHEAELQSFVAQSRALGVRVVGYYNPYFNKDPMSPEAPDVQMALSNNWFLRDASGAVSDVWLISGTPLDVFTVDLTSDAARAFFTDQFKRALNLGYSGWMYDFGEYVQPSVLSASGITGEELHNLFPVVYDKAAFDALQAGPAANDWYYFSRSGYTGAQQYAPMVWSGDPDASFSDAEGVPAQVRAGINLSLSGVAHWGSDIGGFKCEADGGAAANGELLARWIELGSMCSNMHDEDACSGGSGKATLWTSPDAQAAWKDYAALHTRLFPYLFTLANQAHATGAPVIRALFLEHPDRVDLASVDDTYYFGDALLVAPVVARGATTRDVQLPAGRWLDWRDQTLISGGMTVTIPAPLGKLPLFLREAHLIPMLDDSIQTLDDGMHPGIIGPADVASVYDVVGLLANGDSASFTLYDGGTLTATLNGAFAPPSFPMAATEADLKTCTQCWRSDAIGTLTRIRITTNSDVAAGGLSLKAQTMRSTRWDVYLAP
jgi:alpha-glucosidase (family GH31 glycosyl hydrolase)